MGPEGASGKEQGSGKLFQVTVGKNRNGLREISLKRKSLMDAGPPSALSTLNNNLSTDGRPVSNLNRPEFHVYFLVSRVSPRKAPTRVKERNFIPVHIRVPFYEAPD